MANAIKVCVTLSCPSPSHLASASVTGDKGYITGFSGSIKTLLRKFPEPTQGCSPFGVGEGV